MVFGPTFTGVVGRPRSAFFLFRSTPIAAAWMYSRASRSPLVLSIPSARPSRKNAVRRHRGRVAGVDVHRRDSVGARVQRGEERSEPLERGAVAARGRHGDERPADEPADDREERRFHAGDRDDDVGLLDLLQAREQAQDAGDADVGHERRGDAEVLERAARLFGDRGVRGAGRDDGRPCPRPRAWACRPRGAASPSARRSRRGPGSGERPRPPPTAPATEPRDEHVVGARELPADLDDLRGGLALRRERPRGTRRGAGGRSRACSPGRRHICRPDSYRGSVCAKLVPAVPICAELHSGIVGFFAVL